MVASNSTLIMRNDCRSSIRGTLKRMRQHYLTTLFAILLVIPFMAGITGFTVFIFTEESMFSDLLSPGDFFFAIYIVVSGRALTNSIRHIYHDPTTELLRIIPITTKKVYRGKFLSILAMNILTFTVFYGGFLFFFLLIYPDPITFSSFVTYTGFVYIIALFGTLSGFVIPMIYYLPWNLKKRTLTFLTPVLLGGALIINISDLEASFQSTLIPVIYPAILGFFSLLLLTIILGMTWYFSEAIHSYSPYAELERDHTPRLVSITNSFLLFGRKGTTRNRHSRIVAAKEFLSTMRDSYFYIYTAMTVILIVMGVMMITSVPQEMLDQDWGWLIYPMMISFMLFIEGAFMVTLGSISLIGKEGKRLWILRSLPISGYEVLHGKAVSVIIPSIVGGLSLASILLFIAKLPAGQNLVFLVLTLCIIFTFSGIGIIAGTKYPNFTEGAKGSPDIVFQIFILFICLIFLPLIIVPPMTFYYNSGTLAGLITAIIVLVFSYAVLINGVRMGEKIFDSLSSEEYEG